MYYLCIENESTDQLHLPCRIFDPLFFAYAKRFLCFLHMQKEGSLRTRLIKNATKYGKAYFFGWLNKTLLKVHLIFGLEVCQGSRLSAALFMIKINDHKVT